MKIPRYFIFVLRLFKFVEMAVIIITIIMIIMIIIIITIIVKIIIINAVLDPGKSGFCDGNNVATSS